VAATAICVRPLRARAAIDRVRQVFAEQRDVIAGDA
jgi:hypothetical protein